MHVDQLVMFERPICKLKGISKWASHAAGAANELRVAIDLQTRGFEVAQNMNRFGSFDLAAQGYLDDVRHSFVIQVKGLKANGRPSGCNSWIDLQWDRFDLFAGVPTNDSETIIYKYHDKTGTIRMCDPVSWFRDTFGK